jgi:branched-chain amino acid aminotransferase
MTDSRIEMSSDGSAGFSSGPRDDGSLVYIDGELVPVLEARVSVYDHAFLYGDGVFETVHVVDGRAFRLEEHLDRLERSAAAISLHLPGSREEIRHDLLRTVAANRRRTSFVKLIVTRGAGAEPLLRHEGLKSRMVIIDRPSMPFFEGGEELSMSAAIVGTRKTPAASLDPRIKSLNYLNIIQSRIEAQAAGADESILLDADGRVTEGSIYNVIAVHGRRLTTPAENCLQGITLRTVWEKATELGCQTERTSIYPYDLRTADELLFASTAVGVIPITSLNGEPVGDGTPGPVFAEIRAKYERALRDVSYGTPVPHEVAADTSSTEHADKDDPVSPR